MGMLALPFGLNSFAMRLISNVDMAAFVNSGSMLGSTLDIDIVWMGFHF